MILFYVPWPRPASWWKSCPVAKKKGEFQLQFQLQAIIGDDMICLTMTLEEQHRSKKIQ